MSKGPTLMRMVSPRKSWSFSMVSGWRETTELSSLMASSTTSLLGDFFLSRIAVLKSFFDFLKTEQNKGLSFLASDPNRESEIGDLGTYESEDSAGFDIIGFEIDEKVESFWEFIWEIWKSRRDYISLFLVAKEMFFLFLLIFFGISKPTPSVSLYYWTYPLICVFCENNSNSL